MIVKVIENFSQYLDEIYENAKFSESEKIPMHVFSNEFQNEIILNESDSIILSPNKNFDTDFLIIRKEYKMIKISYVDKNKKISQFEIENLDIIEEIKI